MILIQVRIQRSLVREEENWHIIGSLTDNISITNRSYDAFALTSLAHLVVLVVRAKVLRTHQMKRDHAVFFIYNLVVWHTDSVICVGKSVLRTCRTFISFFGTDLVESA